MHVSPDDASDARTGVDDLEEVIRIVQRHAVQPPTAHRHRVMMHADQNVFGCRCGQPPFETLQLLVAEPPAVVSASAGVEHDQTPFAVIDRATDAERRFAQNLGHQAGCIVVAGDAVHRNPEWLKRLAKALVTGARLVLDEITGRQNDIGRLRVGQRVIDDRTERVEGVHAPHARVYLSVQVRIGQVQESE